MHDYAATLWASSALTISRNIRYYRLRSDLHGPLIASLEQALIDTANKLMERAAHA